MTRRYTGLVAVLCVAAVAACSDDVVAPSAISDAPRSAMTTVVGDGSGNFLVLLRNSNSANAVASKVAALGGSVEYMHAGAGIATVSGLSDAAASQLAASAGVQEGKSNPMVTLAQPMSEVTALP